MVSSGRAADGPASTPVSEPDPVPAVVQVERPLFFFDSDGATVRDVARAISEFWGVSVLVSGAHGTAPVVGRIVTADLRTALDALAFFAGAPYREGTSVEGGSGVFYVGGEPDKILASLPAWGLSSDELGGVVVGGRVVGDRVVIEAPASRIAEVREVLETFKDRPSLVLEVFVLDLATNTTDRVNAWLDSVRIGGGFLARSAVAGATGGAGAVVEAVARPTYDVDIRGLFDLLETDSTARVELRQQAQILSGAKTLLESGQVQERQLYLREPGTGGSAGADLATRIERRTIGLNLTLGAIAYPGGWQVRVDLQDSDVTGGTERTTTFGGNRRFSSGERQFLLLASFTRSAQASAGRAVPILGSGSGWLGRQFRKRETLRATRSVMILARVVSE